MSVLKQMIPESKRSLIRHATPKSFPSPSALRVPQLRIPPSKYRSANDFISSFKQPNYTLKTLPSKPTDIRGLDSLAFQFVQRGKAANMTVLASCKFFSVRFFPQNHYLCQFRKSNIAFGNFNHPVNVLNDETLELALKKYKSSRRSTYRNNSFFESKKSPFDAASGRSKFRKLIKKCLFEAVQGKDVNRVSGFYFIRHFKVPVSDSDAKIVSDTLLKGVTKLQDDRFFRELELLTEKHNKSPPTIRGVRKHNSIAGDSLPLSINKLPFI